MTISEKIYYHMSIKNLQVKEFAEILDIKRVNLSAMLNGRNRFTQDFFEAIIKYAPEIDLNALIDVNVDEDFYKIEKGGSNDSNRLEELTKYLREIKKITLNAKI
ncbi:hypothetical protein C1638_003310 [Chryseobacterium oncorhynchi]|uniref:HTH cro/C1-type domain-containing protein n=2 Tax=Chryseobacterium oncorhynchi TaxID=741074 RepID=A0A316X5I4_9FLAO|nr:hypothetical protein C1638_003310 [Chryseobacterium oncorhynchi]